jgi:Domain of unknown function (DUF5664)
MSGPFSFNPLESLAGLAIPLPEPIEIRSGPRFQTEEDLMDLLRTNPGGYLAQIPLTDLSPELREKLFGFSEIEDIASSFGNNMPDAIEEFQPPVTGTNPKDALGVKKPDLSVVPPAGVLHLASAMMDGAHKYGPFNWRGNAVLSRIYVAAAMRHLMQYLDGEDIDPTSGVHHLGHAMACCAIVLDARETGNLSDNRPVSGAAGNMIRRWSEENKFG